MPEVPTFPVQVPPAAEHDVALTVDQVSVVLPLLASEVDAADRVMVGRLFDPVEDRAPRLLSVRGI